MSFRSVKCKRVNVTNVMNMVELYEEIAADTESFAEANAFSLLSQRQ